MKTEEVSYISPAANPKANVVDWWYNRQQTGAVFDRCAGQPIGGPIKNGLRTATKCITNRQQSEQPRQMNGQTFPVAAPDKENDRDRRIYHSSLQLSRYGHPRKHGESQATKRKNINLCRVSF
jgi:hypothetical protein